MATYKEIFGTNIEVLASDPANPVAGQVWYNSTDNVVKGQGVTTAGSWATGGNVNTGRKTPMLNGAGTQASALFIGGSLPGSTGVTESYNGATWTEVNDLNTARSGGGACGANNTSALAFTGYSTAFTGATESWNGTSWTTVPGTINTARATLGANGVQASALGYGGNVGTPTFSALTESWNGTSWTEVGDLNTARYEIMGAGDSNTAGLAIGGYNPPVFRAFTEQYNGTSWTEVGDLNTARSKGAAAGTYTSALAFAGNPSPAGAAAESWNGTSWTTEGSLSNSRRELGGAGSATAGLAFSGENFPGPVSLSTEEFTGAGAPVTYTFTDS